MHKDPAISRQEEKGVSVGHKIKSPGQLSRGSLDSYGFDRNSGGEAEFIKSSMRHQECGGLWHKPHCCFVIEDRKFSSRLL